MAMAEATTMVIINPAVSSLEIERFFGFTMDSKLLFGLSFVILPTNKTSVNDKTRQLVMRPFHPIVRSINIIDKLFFISNSIWN